MPEHNTFFRNETPTTPSLLCAPQSGEPLSDAAVMAAQYERLTQFQRLLFKHHPQLRELALANCGTLQKRSVLQPALEGLPHEQLSRLVTRQLRWVHFEGFRKMGTYICHYLPYGRIHVFRAQANCNPAVQLTQWGGCSDPSAQMGALLRGSHKVQLLQWCGYGFWSVSKTVAHRQELEVNALGGR